LTDEEKKRQREQAKAEKQALKDMAATKKGGPETIPEAP